VSDVPLVLVVEDEYPLQGLVEEALRDGGFDTAILFRRAGADAVQRWRLIARSSLT
jgi:CheY-like chemotaxis protein